MKFNIDSPVFQFLGTLADFTLLNLVFLVSCIPVVTIGPAVCALFSVVLGEVRGEHGDMVRTYMRAVKENFRSSCFLALFYFITGALLLFHFAFWLQMNTWMGNAVLVLLTFCTALYVLSLMYAFALNARFENPIRRTLKNAVLLALSNPKQPVLLLLMAAATVRLFYVNPFFRILLVLFGSSFLAYCQAFPLTRVFRKYE